MSVSDLLRELEEQGIELWFEGERLRFRAPKGALGVDLRARLISHRSAIVEKLRADAARTEKTFPLSFSQQSLWFVHKQAPKSVAYHIALSARVRSPVDASALGQAVQALVDRHATLRTTYPVDDAGIPYQRVAGALAASFTVREMPAATDAELRAAVESEYRRPFDLERGPILRSSLFSCAPDDHVLLVNVHHIAADGWSLLMLLEELFKLYAEAAGGKPAGLARPAREYSDYSTWQSTALVGPEGERLWSYWRDKLAPPLGQLDLPTDRARPMVQTFRGGSLPFEIGAELTESLKQHALAEGTTPFVFLLATFQAFLFRLAGATDIIVGTPTFGRSKAEFMQVVGDFVNTVPLRGKLSAKTTFRELVLQLKTTVHEALDAQELPLPLLVQKLRPSRDSSRAPLIDTLFILQRFDQFKQLQGLLAGGESEAAVDVGGLKLAPFPVSQQEGQFDLALVMVEHVGSLQAAFKYSADLFDESTIERFLGDYRAILEAISGDPGIPLGDLPSPRGTAPEFALAGDRPRGLHAGGRATERIAVSGATFAALAELARVESTTPAVVCLSAFEVLLQRHSGVMDIALGARLESPMANGAAAAANPLPIRVYVDSDASFVEVTRVVRDATVEASARRERSAKLARKPKRESAGRSLFSVRFAFGAPGHAHGMNGASTAPSSTSLSTSETSEAGVDVSLSVVEHEQGATAFIEYDDALFDAATVRRLAGHYRSILEAVAAEPQLAVSRVPLLAPEERDDLLARIRATCHGSPPVTPVVHLFEEQAHRTPDATAVIDGTISHSYRTIDRAANALARRLLALGAGPGQRVAVSLERSYAVVVGLLAVLKTRAAYVPVDPSYPPERSGYVLEDAEPVVLLTEGAIHARMPVPSKCAVVTIEPGTLASQQATAPTPTGRAPNADPDAVAYVLYTSGSTGRPKGVEVPNRALTNFLASMQHTPGFDATDRLLSVTTISFDIAGLEIFLPLVSGGCVEIVSRDVAADGRRLAALIERSGATVMQATPATWAMLIEAGWVGHGRLKVLCGGEPMSRELANQLLARAGSVWNMYGPTETTIWSTVHRVAAADGPVPIGKPIDNTPVYILDPLNELVPYDIPGEIFIGGAGVARGYLKRSELTASRFVADPFAGGGARMYRTGDSGRLRPDGTLECFGRLDDQVKIRGHRIELGEIESVLREHPLVAAAVVVAREFMPGDVRLVGYYVPRDETLKVRELRELCQRKLAKDMVPSAWVALTAIPLTPNGKTDRKALPAPAVSEPEETTERVAPRDALESQLVAIWEAVLETKVTSVRDNFFDIGGHSLLAARVFARIEKATGVALPLALLMEGGTIEHLATKIRERREPPEAGEGGLQKGGPEAAFSHLVPIRTGGSRPPLFCVHGAGGNVLNLHDIARYISHDRPFYGFQAAGVDGATPPIETIEEMAEKYLAELRAVQPHGPYFLSGYCGGAMVAYEIAQRVRAAGETVAILVLIDLYRPGIFVPDSRRRRWTRVIVDESLSAVARMVRAKFDRDLGVTVRDLRIKYHRSRGHTIPWDLRDYWLTVSFLKASARYRLRPYPGKLTIFRARKLSPLLGDLGDPGPDLGWAPLALGGIAAHEVPGDHLSLTREPNVQVLAAQLEACLRTAEVAPPASTPPGPSPSHVHAGVPA